MLPPAILTIQSLDEALVAISALCPVAIHRNNRAPTLSHTAPIRGKIQQAMPSPIIKWTKSLWPSSV